MVCLCKGAAFSNALIVLRGEAAYDHGLFHFDTKVLLDEIHRPWVLIRCGLVLHEVLKLLFEIVAWLVSFP